MHQAKTFSASVSPGSAQFGSISGSPGPDLTSQSASARFTDRGMPSGTHSGMRIWPVGPVMVESACTSWIAGLESSPPQLPEWCPPSRASIQRSIGKAPRVPSEIVGRSAVRRGPSEPTSASALNRSVCSAQSSRRPGEPVSSPISISHLALKPSLPRVGEHGRLRGDIDRVLALVVDHAAPVVAAVLLGQRPGREARVPSGIEPADDVAVAVAEHGRQGRVLDPLGIEKRPLGARLREGAAREAELLQRRPDFTFKIARKVRGALGILALGRDRDAARKIGLERAGIEIGFGAGNGCGTGHEILSATGGEGGIRTHGRLAPTPVFKTGALNHSATSPDRALNGAKATPSQALRRRPYSPQESLKISMRCLPPERGAVGRAAGRRLS